MNPMPQSFLSTALPVVIAVLFGAWAKNKRLDDFGQRLDRIEIVLDKIHNKALASRSERIMRIALTRGINQL